MSACVSSSSGTSRSRSGSPKVRPITAASERTSRVGRSRRSSRAWSVPCTAAGIASSSTPTASCQPPFWRRSAPRSIRSRRASSRKNGLPPERSARSSATDSGSSPSAACGDEHARGVGRQRAHLDLAVAVRVALARALAQPPRAVVALGAVEEEERDRRLVGDPEDRLDQLERRLVGPVEVLEDEAERLLVGELADELEEDLERPRLDALPVQLPDGGLRLGLEREPDEVRQERVCLLGLVLAEHVRELGLQLEADARLRGGGADAEPLPQQVADRPVGEGLGVGDAARLDEAHAVAVAVAHLPDEPRLADPGLAHDRDDRAAPLDERVHRALEHRQLEVAADEREAGRDGLRLEDLGDAEGLERLADALQVLRSHLLELEGRLDLPLRRRPDDDAAAARDLLEAGGDVHGVAERVERVAAVVAVTVEADDDRAGVDADADGERNAVRGLDLLRVLRERRAGWPGPHGERARRRPRARPAPRRARASRRRRAGRPCRRSGAPARS